MSNKLKLNIADIVFLFITHKRTSMLRDSFPYRLFLSGGKPEVVLRLYYGSEFRRNNNFPRKILFDTQPSWRLYYSNRKYILEARSHIMVLTSDFTSGEIYIAKNRDDFPFAYPLDEILMINLLWRKRGILVHACGMKSNNSSGLLFAGTSAAGKSTMANLWKDKKEVTILSDDRVIIRRKNQSFWIYGTPWHGDAKVCSSERAPLEKIFFLKHDKENCIKRLNPLDAASRLIVCSFPTFWDKKGMEFTLNFCSEIAEKIPCYELGFLPDSSVINFLGDVP